LPDTYLSKSPGPSDNSDCEETQLNSGRDHRFRSLYEIHASAVARYVARRVPADDIQDVVADTFLTAWRRLDQVPEDAVPWLFGTARRHIANRRRSTRRRRALDSRLAEGAVESPQSEIEIAEMDDRLVAAIRRLPAKEREALMLVAWDGLDPKRAARAAGCSGGALRVRLYRARSHLRRDLESPSHNQTPQPLPKAQTEDAR
jgi:RNA polymerase sigma-70 factor (ECF subfamily)